ncbi:MAG: TlpA disulfide reductase family protein [Planctomycetota bacterium]
MLRTSGFGLWSSVCVSAAAVMVSSSVAFAQQSAGQVLQRAVETARELQSFEAKAKVGGEGGFAGLLPKGEATLKMARARDEGEVLFDALVEGTIKSKADGDEAPAQIRVRRTPEMTVSVEPGKKLVHELSGRTTRTWDGSLDLYVTPWTLGMLSPYDREMSADKVEYAGEETLNGETVDVILVEYAEAPQQPATRGGGSPLDSFKTAKWSFARSDGLPRRVEWVAGGAALSFSLIVEYTDIKTNTGVEASSFVIETPEGFERRTPTADRSVLPSRVAPSGRTVGVGERVGRPVRPAPPPTPAAPAFDAAPDFELATASGDVVTKQTLAGKVSVFYFWGTWCVPCRVFSPLVSGLVDTFEGEPVGVYGLAVRERDAVAPAEYLAEKGYKHTLLLGSPDSGRVGADAVARAFRVRVYPSIAVVGAEGELVGFFRPERGVEPSETIGQVESAVREYLENHSDKLGG